MYVLVCGLVSSRLGFRITTNSSGKKTKGSLQNKRKSLDTIKSALIPPWTRKRQKFFHNGNTLTTLPDMQYVETDISPMATCHIHAFMTP